MSLKLLIDECLSPLLVQQARDAGHAQSTCVRDRGWSGTKDWRLIQLVTADDYTLVTVNARDFRGPLPRHSAIFDKSANFPAGPSGRNASQCRCGQRFNLRDDLFQSLFRYRQIVLILHVQPRLGAAPKRSSQTHCHIGADAVLAVEHIRERYPRDANALGERGHRIASACEYAIP